MIQLLSHNNYFTFMKVNIAYTLIKEASRFLRFQT